MTGESNQSASVTRTILTPANVVTMVRIFLVPLFVIILLSPWPQWLDLPEITDTVKRYVAAGVFIVISCTDWLDGYLARSRNEVTAFGKFMDPLADKILVAAALLALIELGALPSWVALIILVREFIVAGLRMMAALEGVVIAASYIGKAKTVFQMAAIVLFTIKEPQIITDFSAAISNPLYMFSWLIMIIAIILTIISLIDYIMATRRSFGITGDVKDETVSEPSMDEVDLDALSREVVSLAIEKKVTIGTAESLTGGLITSYLTSVPGSSQCVRGGVVSYASEVKESALSVNPESLATEGAVSESVAREMAEGARRVLDADIAVAVTGIAGPGGEEPGKPIGTVWMGVCDADGSRAELFTFGGDREAVRAQTVACALRELRSILISGVGADPDRPDS